MGKFWKILTSPPLVSIDWIKNTEFPYLIFICVQYFAGGRSIFWSVRDRILYWYIWGVSIRFLHFIICIIFIIETSELAGIYKKLWEELICLLSLHKLTANNIQCHHLHTKFHPNPQISSKSCTHLRSLDVRHLGMFEATKFNNME
jgi:hypothetical protein